MEREFLRRVSLTGDLLIDHQAARRLLDVDAGDGREREVHVAGGAGRAALGIEDRQRVLLGFCPAFLTQIVPQIDVFADRGMDAADVADKLVIQKDPHIVVAEERVFQRPDIVRRQREFDGILHAEEGVVRLPVVAVRKICGFVCPV